MKMALEGLSSYERRSLAIDLCEALKKQGTPCDYFTANRIINSLLKAYHEAFQKNPEIRQAVLNGNFEYVITGGEV